MHYYWEQIRARRKAEGKQPGLIESGFTLIELLIVIVVLGILAAVVIFALSGVTQSSAVSACNADAKSVDIAVSAYHNLQTGFPPAGNNGTSTGLVPTYLKTWPNNPQHYAISIDANGNVFVTPKGGSAQQYDSTSNPCTNVP